MTARNLLAPGRSDSVRGAPSSRFSWVKIANIDLSRGSQPSRSPSISSRTCCSLAGKLTTLRCPGKNDANGAAAVGGAALASVALPGTIN
jgi:hypothetical protein